jgi:hypothetical protein
MLEFLQPAGAKAAYRRAAAVLAPRWLWTIGPSPWFGDTRANDDPPELPARPYHRASALLALGLTCDGSGEDQPLGQARECVRAALIHWQLLLGRDGRPRLRAARRDPFTIAASGRVVRLLSDVPSFQTRTLIDDVSGHIAWLARRTEPLAWVEAQAIGALCDAATLVRDVRFLQTARTRLGRLLSAQDVEGWFADAGGPDLGRWSVTLDALARVFRDQEWPELEEPLRRTLRFSRFVAGPDARRGYGPIAPIGPYGVELLAGMSSDAAGLARDCRGYCESLDSAAGAWLHDGECAEWGASVALAIVDAAPRSLPSPGPFEGMPTRFPHAGVWITQRAGYRAVLQGRKGAALHVAWRDGSVLADPGVCVVFPHGIKTGGRVTALENTGPDTSFIVRGLLRRTDGAPELRAGGRFWRRRRFSAEESVVADHRFQPHLHDHFEREVTFGSDWITLRDRVDLLLPCLAMVCQSAAAPHQSIVGRPPIFIEGGRHLEVTRTYRAGKLVEQRVARTPRPANDA